ncbi:hypothetical protein Hanom_Chr10g00881991 [Helianthus anomalus]
MLISARICFRRSYTTVAYAHTIKTSLIQEPHNVNMFQVNTELKGLVKSGRLNGARQVLDTMPHIDEVT